MHVTEDKAVEQWLAGLNTCQGLLLEGCGPSQVTEKPEPLKKLGGRRLTFCAAGEPYVSISLQDVHIQEVVKQWL